jgi:sugar-specific transcriptional regulator TrmB
MIYDWAKGFNMTSTDEDISILNELGLTFSQAKIYLSLAKTNSLTAQEIAAISKVSRPDVYRILTQLQETGLTQKIISKPVEFQAIPIDECITTLMNNRIQKTTELKHKAKKLILNFKQQEIHEQSHEKNQFVLLPHKRGVHANAEKMLHNVQNCVCFLIEPRRFFSWAASYMSLFQEVLLRKVDCRLITSQFDEKSYSEQLKTLMQHSNFTLKIIPELPKAIFSLWDKKTALIVTSHIGSQSQTPTLWSNNNNIVSLCQDYFEHLWANTK